MTSQDDVNGELEMLRREVVQLRIDNARLRDEAFARIRNLNGRDDFIVSKGLWSEFTDQLRNRT